MNLEIINKLYLELSQIATAKTGRENYLEILLEKKDKEMEAAQAHQAETITQLEADNAKYLYAYFDLLTGAVVFNKTTQWSNANKNLELIGKIEVQND